MKKTIKKILALALALIATFSFVGCQAKSAYQIAVENGFQGDEAAWLEYLQGAPGKDGKDLDIREIYEEACKGDDGFKGTFLEFLKEYFADNSLDITEDNDTAQIAENMLSVVSVQAFQAGSTGSGVIVQLDKQAGDALILTNYHVVYDAKSKFNAWKNNIYVYPYGSMMYTTKKEADGSYSIASYGDGLLCEYVGGSMNYDIAILRVKNNELLKQSNVLAATMGRSNDVVVGEKVFAIGNPKGAGIAVTEGVLSLDSEAIDLDMEVPADIFNSQTTKKVTIEYRVMRTDAAINSGNSGGGLFNTKGELIGIVNAKSVSTIKTDENKNLYIDENSGMGYALPITQAKYVMNNLLANGGVIKLATFGIQTYVTASSAKLDQSGNVYVEEEVSIYKVAERKNALGEWEEFDCIAKGKFEEGDILKTIQIGDGEIVKITRDFTVREYLLNVRMGDTVKVVVERNGRQETVVLEFNAAKYFTDK